MYQNAYLDQSIQFGQFVENQYASHANRKSRGVKQAGFLVLWRTSMPSVLVEIGFLTNASDRKALTGADGQKTIASSIFRAIKSRKEIIEKAAAKQNTD